MRAWIDVIVESTAVPAVERPDTIKVDGIERPVHNSEGALIAETDEGLVAFWRWFGKSKLVDQHGRPRVLFRGDRPDKTEFSGREDPSNTIQGNIFFTDQRGIAKGYTNHRGNSYLSSKDMNASHGLYAVYLKFERPVVADAKGESWSEIPVTGRLKKALGGWDQIQIDDLALHVQQNMRNDSLIVTNVWDQFGDGDQFIAFSKDQIWLI